MPTKQGEVEAVLCEVVKSWVTSDWMCCPHIDGVLGCCHRNDSKCARKVWPQGQHHPIRPKCIGEYGTEPDLICDNCSWFSECVEETIK